MRVLIFTEGGSQVGLGHISRCSSLYDELDSRGVEVEFIINGDPYEINIIHDKNINIINWLAAEFLNQYIKEHYYCIVDSYLANEELYQIISTKSQKCIFIDDFARIKYPKGIIVNPALNTEGIKYPVSEESDYLLGSQYIILRRPFINSNRATINDRVKEVLITLGGSDLRNLTPAILKQLSSSYPEMVFNVVIGKANKNVAEIKNNRLKNINFYHNANADEMRNMMLNCDMAITAAGQTIYELLATQTPFIPIKVVENQGNNIIGLRRFNLIDTVLDYQDAIFLEKLATEFNKLLSFTKRKTLYESCKKMIDGYGTKRIINFLIGAGV